MLMKHIPKKQLDLASSLLGLFAVCLDLVEGRDLGMAIWDKTIDRRDFLKTAAGAAAAFAAASILPKQGSAAPRDIETTAIKFSEMQKLSPTEMAKRCAVARIRL